MVGLGWARARGRAIGGTDGGAGGGAGPDRGRGARRKVRPRPTLASGAFRTPRAPAPDGAGMRGVTDAGPRGRPSAVGALARL